MTAEDEVTPVRMVTARWRGRIALCFIFAQILETGAREGGTPPERTPRGGPDRCRPAHHNALAISSFMISLVPPQMRCTRASAHISATAVSCMKP